MRISDWSSDVCSSDLKHKVKDPTTGKDVTRLNPESEWIRKEVPDLRIITDDLWEAAKRQQDVLAERNKGIKEAAMARSINGRRRPAYLMTGLRSDDSRVGKRCVSTCRSRWAPDHEKQKQQTTR